MRGWRTVRILAASLVAVLLVIGCGQQQPSPAPVETGPVEDDPVDEPTAGVRVVATTSILGDIVRTLIGEDGEVEVLMPPGSDPHTFQPSAADAALLRDADLVVANGLNLEENLISMLVAAAEDGVPVLELADQLDPIAFGDAHTREPDHDHGDDEHGHADDDHDKHGHEAEHGHDDEDGHEDEDGHDHDHGPDDPHVWFDPVRMAEGVRIIAAALADVDSQTDPDEWTERGEAYATELLAVHEDLAALYALVPSDRRVLVTNHDSLGYLAHRYDFEVVGTVIPGASTQAETDPRSFASLVETVERLQISVIFAENTDSTRLAEQLANEVVGRSDLEVTVVRLYTDALGEPGSGAETYVGLLTTTAERIVEALT